MPVGVYIRTQKNIDNLRTSHLGQKGYWTGKKRPDMIGNTNGFKKGGISLMKGKHHTEESNKKNSESHKGKIPWNKDKKIQTNTGRTHFKKGHIPTEEHRRNLSEANKGKKKPPFTKEHLENMSKANKGKHFSLKTEFKEGQTSGKNNNNWLNGISFEPYSTDWTKTLKRSIRERDHYTCRLCGLQQTEETFLVHHIDYNKKNCNPNNLITLCRSCHTKTNYNREYWTNYFNNLLNNKIICQQHQELY